MLSHSMLHSRMRNKIYYAIDLIINCLAVVSRCLKRKPSARSSARELQELPWFMNAKRPTNCELAIPEEEAYEEKL